MVKEETYGPTFEFSNRSETVPPATLRKALPVTPVKKRKMRWTGALVANATGKFRTEKEEWVKNGRRRT
jgi:hypothetical protein